MPEENLGQELRLEKIDEMKNYLTEKRKQNELVSKKHKKTYTTLNYVEHLLILASTVTWCVSISLSAYLLVIPVSIASSTTGLKICPIIAGIKIINE